MIVALALAISAQGLSHVAEWVDPGARFVSIQAVVELPPLDARQRAEVQLLAATMADQVEGYTRSQMRSLAASVGGSLRITTMPDHLRISFSTPTGQIRSGLSMINQILQTSQPTEEVLNKALADLPYRSSSLWSSALRPSQADWTHVRRQDVIDLYHQICRPDRVWLAVGGPIQPGEAATIWSEIAGSWDLPTSANRFSYVAGKRIETVPGSESVVELRCPEIKGTDVALPAKLLALIALGSGKSSSMFETLREVRGWSYRQEGLLWPSENGFVPRLIMLTGDKTPLPELAKTMKDDLVAASKAWTEDDLNRAKGMAEGILLRGIPMSPLYFAADRPVLSDLDDQTFMAAYWPMKTGQPWAPKKLLGQMALASLSDLKDCASKMLEGAIPQTVPARG